MRTLRGKVRRNMPDPVTVMIIGRLAIDHTVQGRSIGPALLRDAVLRALQAGEIAGHSDHATSRDFRSSKAVGVSLRPPSIP